MNLLTRTRSKKKTNPRKRPRNNPRTSPRPRKLSKKKARPQKSSKRGKRAADETKAAKPNSANTPPEPELRGDAPGLTLPGNGARVNKAAAKPSEAGRYASDHIRGLPTPNGKRAILQATDGRQAVCVFCPTGDQPGLTEPVMIPPEIFPTRKRRDPVVLTCHETHWQSSEGRLVPRNLVDDNGQSRSDPERFPPVGDVLPHRDQSRHITLGVDVDLLAKVAGALGTTKLALLISPPAGSDKAVSHSIAVCPATDEAGVEGIGVVMPLSVTHDRAYYESHRTAVLHAESSLK